MRRYVLYVGIILALVMSTAAQTSGLPEFIPLDSKDKKYIKDTTQELFRLGFGVSLTTDRMTTAVMKMQAILRPYCKCSEEDFQDYIHERGLPSVINRMRAQNLSRQDSIKFQQASDELDALKRYRDSQQRIYDSTFELFEARMLNSFNSARLQGATISLYRLDISGNRFVRLSKDEPGVSLKQVMDKALDDLIKKVQEDTDAALKRLQEEGKKAKYQRTRKRRKQ